MNIGQTVFSQIMEFLPLHEFHKCVERYQGHYKVKRFSCLDQFLCMAFAQLTFRESLRDIEACLNSMKTKLYHMGIRSLVFRNTLSNANNIRDWRIYADFAQVLINTAIYLYQKEDFGIQLKQTVYALDATTIDLCLSLFPWAQYSPALAGVRVQTLLNLRGPVPSFVEVTRIKGYHEVLLLDRLVPEPGSFYIMDRAYLSFKRLYKLHEGLAFFVVRSKNKIHHRRLYSHPVDKSYGLRSDQTVVLTGTLTAGYYPEKIRRIVVYDKEHDQRLIIFTNHFRLSAKTIAELYRERWKIELFFKWIKQHLRIKKFYGTSENAVKTQIWIAICVYVLVAIIRKSLKLNLNLYTILQILSVSVFEKIPLSRLFDEETNVFENNGEQNQLLLFNL